MSNLPDKLEFAGYCDALDEIARLRAENEQLRADFERHKAIHIETAKESSLREANNQDLRAENEKLRKRNEELLKAIIQMHREANARTDGGEGE